MLWNPQFCILIVCNKRVWQFKRLKKIKFQEAIPAIKAKVDALISFMKREVVPELQEIKDAYNTAAVENDNADKKTPS